MRHAFAAALPVALTIAVTVSTAQESTVPSRKLQIRVAAVDGQGKPVMDLRPDEFEVAINLYRVPIDRVTIVRAQNAPPRLVVLLFDDLATESVAAPRVREIAKRIVARLGQDDEMTIASLTGDFTKPTGDRALLLRAIDRYNGYRQGYMPIDRMGEHVLETVTSVSRQVAEVEMRKVIIGVGAAWMFDTPIPPPSIGRELRKEWTAAVRAMAASDVNLYAIEQGGVGRAPFTSTGTGFASESGGYAFTNTNDLKGAVDRIFDEVTNYYVLETGDPPTGRNDEIRELDVKVKRSGVTVRARRWITGGAK